MLPSDELADLRADILETLPDTCSIRRPTATTDDYGNVAESYAEVDTAYCRVDPFSPKDSGSEGIVAQREASVTWYRLALEYDADIQYGDRVVIGGVTYELVQLYDAHSLRAVQRAVIAMIQGDS
jgi:head-tail adaptor